MTQTTRKQPKARYTKVWDPRRRQSVLLHRELAAAALGRPLQPREVVHHIDGNPTNNALSNLQVFPSQAYHAHFEYHRRCQRAGQFSLFDGLLPARMP